MRRRLRKWWRAAIAVAAIVSPHAAAADQPVHDVQIVATQYAFEPATIHVTAGESVRLVIRSNDVVHGFSIPALKIDARIPAGGEPITVEFVAPSPGQYDIACSEYCGAGHGQNESLPGERGLEWNSNHGAGDVRRRRRPIGVANAVRP